MLRVVDIEDGEPIAVPDSWQPDDATPPPRVRIVESKKGAARSKRGDRVLARTEEAGKGWRAHPIKKLPAAERIAARRGRDRRRGQAWLAPVDKRDPQFRPGLGHRAGRETGNLVLAERDRRGRRAPGCRVLEVLGDPLAPARLQPDRDPQARHPAHLPRAKCWPKREHAAKLPLSEDKREDLRALPIVAIDPADARDHDDAIWAEPDGEGGYRAIVAIADVSFYVRPGSQLDREARKRGNSVYFPDRVVPMLPEVLSADVCSLKRGRGPRGDGLPHDDRQRTAR